VLGTRPEIIKVAPLIQECASRGIPLVVVHTGQHYDRILDAVFFSELRLDPPSYNLQTGEPALPYPEKLGLMTTRVEEVLRKENVGIVLVQGDTTSALAGAFAAKRLGLPVAHLEAGLRSRDYAMTEEWNRIMIDRLADVLLAPTDDCREQLIAESADPARIRVVGNSIVDAVLKHKELGASVREALFARIGIEAGAYLLATVHRAENTDDPERLRSIFDGIAGVAAELGLPAVMPLHPRTTHLCEQYDLMVPGSIQVIEPLGYLEFLQLEACARLVLTDSGGIQEEASILKVPCVTMRENTERPETVKAGMNVIGGTDTHSIVRAAREILKRDIAWSRLYGKGTTAPQTLDILTSLGYIG